MGLQSARMYFRENDHKDIWFRDNYHKAIYFRGKKLWEKLYPEKYFLVNGQRTVRENGREIAQEGYNLIFSKNLAYKDSLYRYFGTQKTEMIGYDISRTNGINDWILSDVLNRKTGLFEIQPCFTKDLNIFKKLPVSDYIYYSLSFGFIDVHENKIYKISDDSSIETIDSEPITDLDVADLYRHTVYADYLLFDLQYIPGKYDYAIKSKYETFSYKIIGEDGKIKTVDRTMAIKSGASLEADEFYEYYYALFGNTVIIGDDMYSFVDTTSTIPSSSHYRATGKIGGLFKINLPTMEKNKVLTLQYPASFIDFVYLSSDKSIFLCYMYLERSDSSWDYMAALVTISGGQAQSKTIQNFNIKVYGEERNIEIIGNYNNSDIEKYDYSILLPISSEFGLGGEFGLSVVYMKNGIRNTESSDEMLIYFHYKNRYSNDKSWEIMGYIYFDNLEFAPSENNYIYIIEEWKGGEKIYDRWENK